MSVRGEQVNIGKPRTGTPPNSRVANIHCNLTYICYLIQYTGEKSCVLFCVYKKKHVNKFSANSANL